jgi:hypothetical protein
MGTRRHRRRYRGGEEFVKRPFVAPANPAAINRARAAHENSEIKRYNEWKAKREVEAREDAKGREEDANMASFYEKQKRDQAQELIDTAKHREEADIESTRKADEKARLVECKEHLRSHSPPLKSPSAAQEWLSNKLNQKANPQDYKEVRDCLRVLTAAKGGRKTRRRKSHRRR